MTLRCELPFSPWFRRPSTDKRVIELSSCKKTASCLFMRKGWSTAMFAFCLVAVTIQMTYTMPHHRRIAGHGTSGRYHARARHCFRRRTAVVFVVLPEPGLARTCKRRPDVIVVAKTACDRKGRVRPCTVDFLTDRRMFKPTLCPELMSPAASLYAPFVVHPTHYCVSGDAALACYTNRLLCSAESSRRALLAEEISRLERFSDVP